MISLSGSAEPENTVIKPMEEAAESLLVKGFYTLHMVLQKALSGCLWKKKMSH